MRRMSLVLALLLGIGAVVAPAATPAPDSKTPTTVPAPKEPQPPADQPPADNPAPPADNPAPPADNPAPPADNPGPQPPADNPSPQPPAPPADPPPAPPADPPPGGGASDVKGLSWFEVLGFSPAFTPVDGALIARLEKTGTWKLRYMRRNASFPAHFNPDPNLRAQWKKLAEECSRIINARKSR